MSRHIYLSLDVQREWYKGLRGRSWEEIDIHRLHGNVFQFPFYPTCASLPSFQFLQQAFPSPRRPSAGPMYYAPSYSTIYHTDAKQRERVFSSAARSLDHSAFLPNPKTAVFPCKTEEPRRRYLLPPIVRSPRPTHHLQPDYC